MRERRERRERRGGRERGEERGERERGGKVLGRGEGKVIPYHSWPERGLAIFNPHHIFWLELMN